MSGPIRCTRLLRPRDRLLMEGTADKGHGVRPVGGKAMAVAVALA